MNLSAEKMFEELPGPISFVTSRDAKLDLGQVPPPLNIKYETQSFPILLDCVKEETVIENDEQNLKPLFSNDLLNHKTNEVKKEDQTPLSPSVPDVKVEVGECNSVTTQLIIGQENQMKVENITNLPKYESSNNLMEGDNELCSLKLCYEGPKAEYMTQSANIAIQSSDEINTCKVTNKIAEYDSEEVQKNLEKDTQDNSNKCAQHQSEKDVQDGAKIVQTDHTSQGWNTLFLSIIVVLVVMKMRATATIVEQLVRRGGTQNAVDYLLGG
uniref:Uncharacterized protein n=1 Tax=Timema genevievae TaxID=629358 RepID=A0A7R9PK91_TIMGE|nr:unnamed protein product [Timema genevievae]